jgi:hypothetical protein
MISGIVMNGPIPTICAMFKVVAGNSPIARMNPRELSAGAESVSWEANITSTDQPRRTARLGDRSLRLPTPAVSEHAARITFIVSN